MPLKECLVPFPKINGLTLEEDPLRPEIGTVLVSGRCIAFRSATQNGKGGVLSRSPKKI